MVCDHGLRPRRLSWQIWVNPVRGSLTRARETKKIKRAQREFCRNWPNQTEFTVAGSNLIQEEIRARRSAGRSRPGSVAGHDVAIHPALQAFFGLVNALA
jgi:hypothetical protein